MQIPKIKGRRNKDGYFEKVTKNPDTKKRKDDRVKELKNDREHHRKRQ